MATSVKYKKMNKYIITLITIVSIAVMSCTEESNQLKFDLERLEGEWNFHSLEFKTYILTENGENSVCEFYDIDEVHNFPMWELKDIDIDNKKISLINMCSYADPIVGYGTFIEGDFTISQSDGKNFLTISGSMGASNTRSFKFQIDDSNIESGILKLKVIAQTGYDEDDRFGFLASDKSILTLQK